MMTAIEDAFCYYYCYYCYSYRNNGGQCPAMVV